MTEFENQDLEVNQPQEVTETQGEPLTPSESDASSASNPTETAPVQSPSEEVEPLAEGEE